MLSSDFLYAIVFALLAAIVLVPALLIRWPKAAQAVRRATRTANWNDRSWTR